MLLSRRLEAQIDYIKRQLYFPDHQGWQIRLGSAGIYVGAKDVVLSRVTGGFRASCSKLVRQGSQEQVAVLRVSLGPSKTNLTNGGQAALPGISLLRVWCPVPGTSGGSPP